MFILFDHNVPRPLRRCLTGHTVRTAYEMGWAGLSNGALVAAATHARFDLFVTADQNLEYQQNLRDRIISLVVLGAGRWRLVAPHQDRVMEAVEAAAPGSYAFIDIPLPPKPRRAAS